MTASTTYQSVWSFSSVRAGVSSFKFQRFPRQMQPQHHSSPSQHPRGAFLAAPPMRLQQLLRRTAPHRHSRGVLCRAPPARRNAHPVPLLQAPTSETSSSSQVSALALLDRARILRKRLMTSAGRGGRGVDSAAANNSGKHPGAPSLTDIESLIGDMVMEVRLCDESYYGAEPVLRVRDEEYDELVMHLAELERQFPQLADEDSPTATVGNASVSSESGRGISSARWGSSLSLEDRSVTARERQDMGAVGNERIEELSPLPLASVDSTDMRPSHDPPSSHRFSPHRHTARMLSLGNAYDRADVASFLARVSNLEQDLPNSAIGSEQEVEFRDGGSIANPLPCTPPDFKKSALSPRSSDSSASTSLDSPVRGIEDPSSQTISTPTLPRHTVSAMCAEAKVDGVALGLSYRRGELVAAATRGDGDVGDDVSDNVRIALVGRGLPAELPEAVNVDVRGEVYISRADFMQLNGEDGMQFANARNAAAGGLKHKDPAETERRKLRFISYECLKIPDDFVAAEEAAGGCGRVDQALLANEIPFVSFWPSQIDTLRGLESWGFDSMNIFALCRSEEEIVAFATEKEAERLSLPFEADGVVIKVNDSVVRHAMGSTAKSPRGAIAFKFAAVGAQTVLEGVVMQVSRTGSINPVALLRPVEIGGVTVKRATLHNFDEIERLDVCVGDTVLVQRGGDVIPKIVMVKEKAESVLCPDGTLGSRQSIEVPSACPSCEGPVLVAKEANGATTVRCQEKHKCAAQNHGRLQHFARREAMDISGLGPKTLTKLMESGLVTRIADLFSLTVDSIARLDGFKEKSSASLYAAIQTAKAQSLERVVIGLGVPGVGRASAQSLAEYAKSVDGLRNLGMLSTAELMSLPNVAEKSAELILAYLREPRVQSELAALSDVLRPSTITDYHMTDSMFSGQRNKDGDMGTIAGKLVAFSGALESMSRVEAGKRVRASGGKTSSSVSKRTDYLVVGDEPGSKQQKANRLGVQVISEAEFLGLLGADV